MLYAAICAIAKDENIFLREWAIYHFSIGFEHIILYDNASKISVRNELQDFIDAGIVTVIDFPLQTAQQLSAYFHCIKNYQHEFFWIAFIDIDEFIVPLTHNDIKDFLDTYRNYGGVAAHWMVFSSNGHIKRPNSPVITSYTNAIGLNDHIKSIVQPKCIEKPISPHHFTYRDGYFCVNEDEVCVPSHASYPIAKKIVINHYYYKSQQDFEDKIQRGFATKVLGVAQRELSTFYTHLSTPGVENTDILRFLKIYTRFSKLHATTLAKYIQTYIPGDMISDIQDVSTRMLQGDLDIAQKKCTILARYFDSPAITFLQSFLYLRKGQTRQALELFSTAIHAHANDIDTLRILYENLSTLYKIMEKNDVSQAILQFIHET